MPSSRSVSYYEDLVHQLRARPTETETVEFKRNDDEPEETGEYISALANGAALHGRQLAYLIWGIDNVTHEVVGTSCDYRTKKVGNEELENWLARLVTPQVHFKFQQVTIGGHRVVILEIAAADRQPVQFRGVEYIRVGSYKKKLKDFPEKERELWRTFDRTLFEAGIAREHVTADEVLQLLDYQAYFELLHRPRPDYADGILQALAKDKLIETSQAGGWDITNLGAVLFARQLDDFDRLRRKVVRVISYRGTGRTETIKEQTGTKGYASGFGGLMTYLTTVLPANEVIKQALRVEKPMYPELAIRELVAQNALIHQDLRVTGAGPTVESFADRMEITNPGTPLVDVNRFLDTPPRSRNEQLASLMRRAGVCEERGSGVDKVVAQSTPCSSLRGCGRHHQGCPVLASRSVAHG